MPNSEVRSENGELTSNSKLSINNSEFSSKSAYKPYPEYKDSGVEWFGEIPNHWDITYLKHKSTRIGDGLHSTPTYHDNGDYFFINGNNLVDGHIVTNQSTKKVDKSEYNKHKVRMNKNTILLSINGTIGNLAFYQGEPVILGKSAAYINCTSDLYLRFCFYVMQSDQVKRFFDLEMTGTTISNLSLRSIGNTPLPSISFSEQQKIASFLDYETGKIDELIEKQQNLIALLEEKRQAVISHAVTKGFNPNAPMKDSGVEWLGEVPEHWNLLPIRHAMKIDNGPRLPINRTERVDMAGTYPYWGPTGVLDHINHFRYEGERVIIGEDGDHFLKFATWSMTHWATGQFNVNNHAHVIASGQKCSARWFYYAFLHRDIGGDVIGQGVSRLKLTREGLSKLVLAVPLIAEQEALITHMEQTTNKLEALITKAKSGIQLIQERRTALIYAAVTGKIDVRGWTK